MDDAPRWHVLITTADGRQLYWHRAGARHTLAAALGPLWVANFKPALFQVTAAGAIIPRGSQADALEIVAVTLAPAADLPPAAGGLPPAAGGLPAAAGGLPPPTGG
jgi:hypothetical protein